MTVSSLSATDEYTDLCRRFQALTGLDLSQYKRKQMERRVNAFADRCGAASLTEFGERLTRDEDARAAFLDDLTINVSQLWRNPQVWDDLQRVVLPDLLMDGRLRAWCAGVSYGAEAYTLAALCRSVAPQADVEIFGTDIDPAMIARARLGIFSAREARDAPGDLLAANFHSADDQLSAHDELKAMVRFEVGDLLTTEPEPASYDLVVCRNTVIYFEPPVRDVVHARLASAVRSGGRLVVGSTERVSRPADCGLEAELPFIYRKGA
ncbi:MAG TPA: protein-glutamate O-methyltransferase CheR [Baekduia sp.]|nr:protein-glutamate O-methyltransferase CheR [Baekduia sp.]